MKAAGEDGITYLKLNQPDEEQTDQIRDLYKAAGWWSEEDEVPALVPRIVAGSYCFIVAVGEDGIIGMGRALSDGARDAYVHDVTVAGKYRRGGIGSSIMGRIIDCLRAAGITWISLIAEPPSDLMYRKAGFKDLQRRVPMHLKIS
ncbi:MAG: GNAT family N-acetyltransferase [Syntrophales bacterium]|nr:GNAT family N-acetyltransferase [Syntrophales bacterium]